jgi:transposase
VFFAVADLLNLEVDLLFFDTTSTYFEIEDEDEQGDEAGEPLRRFGHSKDHRPDRPQAVISQVKDDLAGWRLGRCVWVVDRGLSSEENLRYLQRAGGHWIAGQRMRAGEPASEAALARQGRYRQVRENLRVKEVRLGEADSQRRFSVCHNPEEELRDRQHRQRALERIESELERIERLRARSGKAGSAHLRAECALRDHPSYSRYLRQLPPGRLRIDRAKVSAEERLDGKFLLETSDPDITAEDAALGYKNLLEAERSFRDLKGTLRIRPVFHRLDERIRAHVLICWLALLLVRIAERQAGQTWRRMRTELERIKLVTLTGQAGTVQQTTPLTDNQRAILNSLDVPAPPPVTSLDPA